MDTNNAAHIFVKVQWHDDSVSFAASTNYGGSFFETTQDAIPATAADRLWLGNHVYARYGCAATEIPEFDRRTSLLHSGDAGKTWETTALGEYISRGTTAIRERDRDLFFKQYGRLAPERSRLWTPTFLATVSFLLMACGIMERRRGVPMPLLSMGRTIVAVLLLYVFLRAFHWFIAQEVSSQFVGQGYWCRNAPWVPSLKTAVIMNIAAEPLWLAAFLVVVSPILPIGVHCVTGQLRHRIGTTSRYGQWPAIVAVAVWIGIIAWVLFGGSLFR